MEQGKAMEGMAKSRMAVQVVPGVLLLHLVVFRPVGHSDGGDHGCAPQSVSVLCLCLCSLSHGLKSNLEGLKLADKILLL